MNTRDNHILIPIDFSEQSLLALKQSYNLARYNNSSITLLHVIDEDFIRKLSHLFKGDNENENLMRTDVETKLKTLATETQAESGLTVKTIVTTGKIYDEIIRVSNDLNAILIVMGTNGTDSLKKKFIGSNSMRVINEANCPVISIKGKNHRLGCKRILLPLDLSRESRDKVNKTIEIAKYFNSEIFVISLYDFEDDFLLSKLKLQMDAVQQFITDNGVNATAEMVHSKDIAKSVLEYSEKIDADLIVIISQAEIEIAEWFLGSAAQEIINTSAIPVMSIKANIRKDTYEFVLH